MALSFRRPNQRSKQGQGGQRSGPGIGCVSGYRWVAVESQWRRTGPPATRPALALPPHLLPPALSLACQLAVWGQKSPGHFRRGGQVTQSPEPLSNPPVATSKMSHLVRWPSPHPLPPKTMRERHKGSGSGIECRGLLCLSLDDPDRLSSFGGPVLRGIGWGFISFQTPTHNPLNESCIRSMRPGGCPFLPGRPFQAIPPPPTPERILLSTERQWNTDSAGLLARLRIRCSGVSLVN
jgi:hypothetical protein